MVIAADTTVCDYYRGLKPCGGHAIGIESWWFVGQESVDRGGPRCKKHQPNDRGRGAFIPLDVDHTCVDGRVIHRAWRPFE